MLWLLCFLSIFAFADIDRTKLHLVINDPQTALKELEDADWKHCASLAKERIKLLAKCNYPQKALKAYKTLNNPTNLLLEEIAWGFLNKGIQSHQIGIQFTALVSSYLTNDARAMNAILQCMQKDHSLLRSTAIYLGSHYRDQIFQKKLLALANLDETCSVRKKMIVAVGHLKNATGIKFLNKILKSNETTFFEKKLATESMVQITDKISNKTLSNLTKSNKSYLRELACDFILSLKKKKACKYIVKLIKDPDASVRLKALHTLALLAPNIKNVDLFIEQALDDSVAEVAIKAAWITFIKKADASHLKKWLNHPNDKYQRIAAAALASSGPVALETLKEAIAHKNPFVKANIAIGLIRAGENSPQILNAIHDILDSNMRLSIHTQSHFKVLTPTHVHCRFENPKLRDQMIRLHLINLLAVNDDPRATEMIKNLISKERFEITDIACKMLWKEGDAEALRHVKKLLHSKDYKIRIKAAIVLASLGHDDRVINTLCKAYKEANRTQKITILNALADIANPKCIDFFVDAMSDSFETIRIIAAGALLRALYS